LEHDPRFNSIEARSRNGKELVAILDQAFATKTRDEWFKILKKAGCIYTPVQAPSEVVSDPQALANNYFVEVDHPERGKTKMTRFPWDFSETPASCRRPAPAFGQHNEEILLEIGYTGGDIAQFREEGVIP